MVQILSTRGRAPKELLGVGAELGGVATRNRIAPETVTVLAPALGDTELHQHGAEATDVGLPTFTHDTSNHRYARIEVRVTEAGAPGAVLQLQYRRRSVGGDFLPAGGPLGAVEASLAAVGDVIGGSVPLTAQCTGDCEFRVVPAGGDGSASPCIENLYVKFMDIPLPASTPIPEPPPGGDECPLPDVEYHFLEQFNYASMDEYAAEEGSMVYNYLNGPGEPNVVLDVVNTYNGHPVMVGLQGGDNNFYWLSYYLTEEWEQPDPPVTSYDVHYIARFDPDWATGNNEFTIHWGYSDFGDGAGWEHYLYLDSTGLHLSIETDVGSDSVKVCDAADIADGTWKYLRIAVDASGSSFDVSVTYGDSCRSATTTVPLSIAGTSFNPAYGASEWSTDFNPTPEYALAEWGLQLNGGSIAP